jgi:hypothetical protein
MYRFFASFLLLPPFYRKLGWYFNNFRHKSSAMAYDTPLTGCKTSKLDGLNGI